MKRPNEKVDKVFSALLKHHMDNPQSKSDRHLNESHQFIEDSNSQRSSNRGFNNSTSLRIMNRLSSESRRKADSTKMLSSSFSAETLTERIQSNKLTAALRLTIDNLDSLIDDNNDLYEDVYEQLKVLQKDELISYVSVLIGALR